MVEGIIERNIHVLFTAVIFVLTALLPFLEVFSSLPSRHIVRLYVTNFPLLFFIGLVPSCIFLCCLMPTVRQVIDGANIVLGLYTIFAAGIVTLLAIIDAKWPFLRLFNGRFIDQVAVSSMPVLFILAAIVSLIYICINFVAVVGKSH